MVWFRFLPLSGLHAPHNKQWLLVALHTLCAPSLMCTRHGLLHGCVGDTALRILPNCTPLAGENPIFCVRHVEHSRPCWLAGNLT